MFLVYCGHSNLLIIHSLIILPVSAFVSLVKMESRDAPPILAVEGNKIQAYFKMIFKTQELGTQQFLYFQFISYTN